jgi:tRNA(fMet)-specific endonuclease VapC
MARYLLDTNILSDLIRNPRGVVSKRLDVLPNDQLATSIIVAAELVYGAVKKRSPSLENKITHMLSGFAVLPFDHPAEAIYADLRVKLERAGRPIGNNDLLIAAHALAAGCTLVTDNVREFSRIDTLVIENWLR